MNKKEKIKAEKFIPRDKNGIEIKKTNLYQEFAKILNKFRTEKDEKDKKNFLNGKFNYMRFQAVQFKNFNKNTNKKGRFKDIYDKIVDICDKNNKLYDNMMESNKPSKKPARVTAYIYFGLQYRKKHKDKKVSVQELEKMV